MRIHTLLDPFMSIQPVGSLRVLVRGDVSAVEEHGRQGLRPRRRGPCGPAQGLLGRPLGMRAFMETLAVPLMQGGSEVVARDGQPPLLAAA